MKLDADDIEAVAARVVELLEQQASAPSRLVDAATLARTLRVDRDWVYARARRLEAIRLGDGPKAPLRFDLRRVREILAAPSRREPRPVEPAPKPAWAPPQERPAARREARPGEAFPVSDEPAMLPGVTHFCGPAGVGPPPDPHTGGMGSDARSTTRASPVRRRTGNLKAPRRPGELWGVEFALNGERHYVSFSGSADWDIERAGRERAYLMEKVNRGEWSPGARVQARIALPSAAAPPYADVAAEALARQVKRLDDPEGRRARELDTSSRSALTSSGRSRSTRWTSGPSRTWLTR